MNNKFSIIIPTLWKSKRIHNLLTDLISCDSVGEIILIDNSNQFKEYYNELLKKTKIIIPESNLFVSGSWNLGIRSAQYENICLCSDDINFDPNIFKMLLEYNNIGIIGQASENYHKEYGSNPIITPLTGIRPWGWGCLIFLKKEYWYNVPEQLKVWYGDDWIVKFNPITKYTLHHFSIKTEMSTTSDLSNFNEIKNQDRIFWETLQ